MQIESILIEKGLLALVLVIVGSFFAKKLERYKSGNAYFNTLMAQRLKAYEEVAEIFGKHSSIIRVCLTALEMQPENLDSISEQLKEEGGKFREAYENSANRLVVCALYFSKDLETTVFNYLLDYSFAMHSFKSGSCSNIKERLQKIQENSNQVFLQMRNEMHSNPFD